MISGPRVDVIIDLGNPLLNHTVDGFLKIGTVRVFFFCNFLFILNIFVSFRNLFMYFASGFWSLGSMLQFRTWKASFCFSGFVQVAATRAAAEDAYSMVKKGIFLLSLLPVQLFGSRETPRKMRERKSFNLESLMKNHSYYVSVSWLIWLKCSSFPVLVWWCWWCNRCWIRFFFFFGWHYW